MSFASFGEEELSLLREVIERQELWRGTSGNMVPRFEDAFGEYLGRRYVFGVCSGTCANETALASLGLEPGDEVICPATAPIFVSLPVVAIGCIPVFAETDPRTLIITPQGVEARISERTRAVVVVHMFGQPAPMDDILEVTRRHGLKVVEDCAQAYSCTYKGRMAGTFGDVACFSMQQSKHITAGEGGIVATDDPDVYKRAVLFGTAGMPWYRYGLEPPKAERVAGLRTRGHFGFGHNYRMSELQGAVALAQLGKIALFNEMRAERAAAIEEELADAPGIDLAHVYPDTVPNYWQYPVRVPAALGSFCEINYLEAVYQDMETHRRTSVGVPLPSHVHYAPGSCPNAEAYAPRIRTFSVAPSLDLDTVRRSAAELRDAVAAQL